MAELNIPNLNKKSEKYIFKNKLNMRRKSKGRLIREAVFMLISSVILVYINYLIPKKALLVENFLGNLKKIFIVGLDLTSYFFQIALVIFIVLTILLASILLIGSIYRIIKVAKRKTKQISYK